MAAPAGGVLRVVATPIGHLGDLSPRAAETLAQADLVLCEDTRHTGALLTHLGLRKTTRSLHAHNELDQIPYVLRELEAGRQIALVSDAGTPCLSDPGARLIDAACRAVQEHLFMEKGAQVLTVSCKEANLRGRHVAERSGALAEGVLDGSAKYVVMRGVWLEKRARL